LAWTLAGAGGGALDAVAATDGLSDGGGAPEVAAVTGAELVPAVVVVVVGPPAEDPFDEVHAVQASATEPTRAAARRA
jgi:hypothetical protein